MLFERYLPWLTWTRVTCSALVSSPLVSALASAFLSRSVRNSADLTGQRALLTPNCLPINSSLTKFPHELQISNSRQQQCPQCFLSHKPPLSYCRTSH